MPSRQTQWARSKGWPYGRCKAVTKTGNLCTFGAMDKAGLCPQHHKLKAAKQAKPTKETWILVGPDELPERFGAECADFRCICSNGFEGSLSLGSAFAHSWHAWPQCFPGGEDSDAVCTNVTVKRTSLR